MTYEEAQAALEAFMNNKGVLEEEWYNTVADALLDVLEMELTHDYRFSTIARLIRAHGVQRKDKAQHKSQARNPNDLSPC